MFVEWCRTWDGCDYHQHVRRAFVLLLSRTVERVVKVRSLDSGGAGSSCPYAQFSYQESENSVAQLKPILIQ